MRYKKTTKSLPEIAKELGVDAIVEGSVSRSGSQVKITAQLIEASRDKHLWADSFQRDLKDVLALQGEVARAIAEKIRIRLTPEERTDLAASRPSIRRRTSRTSRAATTGTGARPRTRSRAATSSNSAVDKDPSYAAGWAGLAAAYHLLSSTPYSMMAPRDGYPKVLEACAKAIALDPNNAEAHAWRGLVRFFFDRDAKAAESDFRRSQELDPRYAQGHQLYSFMLQSLGRFEEAIREAKTGRDADPLSLVQNANVAFAFHFAGRYDEAIEWCQEDPRHGCELSARPLRSGDGLRAEEDVLGGHRRARDGEPDLGGRAPLRRLSRPRLCGGGTDGRRAALPSRS